MAKLAVTVTVLLFTLALSVVASKPENEIIADSHNTLSADSDPFTTNPTTFPESGSSGPELTSSDEITVPVNFMNFHPINRHFPRRPLTFNRRPCHHRRHELFGRRGLQIPYGNDMIFSGEEEKRTGLDPSLDSIVVDIPTIKMFVGPIAVEEAKHHLEEEEDGSSMKITVTLMKRKEEGEGERESVFRTKIRKFLNHLV
ncbi:unnamed protein product [Brassica rapa subsp. narinosa]